MAGENRRQGGKRSFLSGVLITVLLAFALTSGMVGYLLGRNASRSGGELMDTIVLSPGDSSLRVQEVLHFLSGKLTQTAGKPLAGVTVRLDGTDRSDTTDGQGCFYLSDVRPGEQMLEVLDQNGSLLGSLRLSFDFSARDGVSASTGEASAAFQMPEDTRLLEIALTLDEDNNLTVDSDSACLVMKDGRLVSFENKMLSLEDDCRAVTPGGNLVTSEGYVVFPSKGVTVTPQGSQIKQGEDGAEVAPGVIREEDGSVQVDEEIIVEPDGSVKLPDGEILDGDAAVVLTPEGVQEVDPLPEAYEPRLPANAPEVVPSPESQPGESTEGETDGEEASRPEATPEPEPTPQGLSIIDSGTGVTWQQKSVVDLFKNRYGEERSKLDANGEKELLAAPGDSGYYDFRLENPEDFDISYTIAIQETSFHLPIKYSVIDSSDNKSYLNQERTTVENAVASPEILIPAGTVQNFRIEWVWPYEDSFYMRKYDKMDTAAGIAGDKYTVSVFIRAEQVQRGTGDETRYPGIRGEEDPWYDGLTEQRKNSK